MSVFSGLGYLVAVLLVVCITAFLLGVLWGVAVHWFAAGVRVVG
jgi:hypothetical protein